MKTTLVTILALCLFCVSFVLAQNKVTQSTTVHKGVDTNSTAKKPKPKPVPVYLGNSDYRGGRIAKAIFDSLAQQGLTAKDSIGRIGKVLQFRVYYKERNLYEDSLGNYYVGTDLLTDMSFSNLLNNYLVNSLPDRTKKGDTAIFDDVLVKMPDSAVVRGTSMVFAIGR